MIDNLVSIITPVYNAKRHLPDTIQSVLEQTYTDWELILVDDASSDGSYELMLEYAARDERIKTIRQESNMGAAVARNAGLDAARGRYTAFLDSDDIWFPEKLEKQVAFMIKNNYAFTYTDYCFISESGQVTKSAVSGDDWLDYKRLLRGSPIMCSSVLIDRGRLGMFKMPQIRTGQDYATWAMLLRGGGRAYNVSQVLAKYRKTAGSLSSNKLKKFKVVWDINRKLEKLPLPVTVWCMGIYGFKWIKKHYL